MQVTVISNATDLETFLAPYPPDVREIALATRDLLAVVLPADLKQPGLKPLLEAALSAWRKRNEVKG